MKNRIRLSSFLPELTLSVVSRIILIPLMMLIVLGFSWVLYYQGIRFLDPDFGWHMASGRYILQHGIAKTDPFSYTMPSYQFIDHEWITNVLIYLLYNGLGMMGLSIVFLIIFGVSIAIHFPRRHWKWASLPLLLSLTIFLDYFFVRTQVISWLFFSILIKILFTKDYWNKYKWFIPGLMLLWANMHGSFLLGVGVLAYFTVALLFEKKRNVSDAMVFAISVLVTAINPYGIKLIEEVFMQSTDPNMHFKYGEWMPLLFTLNIFYIIYIACFIVIAFLLRNYFSKKYIFFISILLAAGFSSLRHFPFFVITAFPLISEGSLLQYHRLKDKKNQQETFLAGYIFLCIVLLLFSFFKAYSLVGSLHQLTENQLYPQQAVVYLHKHLPQKQMLSVFEWGGYLLWKLPEKRVFLDGRMLNWRLKYPSNHESSFSYQESAMLLTGQISLVSVVKKYAIDTLLLHTTIASLDQASKSTYPTTNDVFPQKIIHKYPPIEIQLAEDGWKIIYRDDTATIYQK